MFKASICYFLVISQCFCFSVSHAASQEPLQTLLKTVKVKYERSQDLRAFADNFSQWFSEKDKLWLSEIIRKNGNPSLMPMKLEGNTLFFARGSQKISLEVNDLEFKSVKINGVTIQLSSPPDLQSYYEAISKGMDERQKNSVRLPGIFFENSQALPIAAWILVAAVAFALGSMAKWAWDNKKSNDSKGTQEVVNKINEKNWDGELATVVGYLHTARKQCTATDDQRAYCQTNRDNYRLKVGVLRQEIEKATGRSVCEINIDPKTELPEKIEFCQKKAFGAPAPKPTPASR